MDSNKVYDLLISNNINIDRDIFDYGFLVFKTYIKYFLVVIPLSIFFNLFFQLICFIIVFIPLRRYIGGYHLDSMKACFIASVLITFFIIFFSTRIEYIPLFIKLIVIFITIFITYHVGAMDHPNKRISIEEKRNYTLKAIKIEFLYLLLMIFLHLNNIYIFSNILFLTIIFCVLNALVTYLIKKSDIMNTET